MQTLMRLYERGIRGIQIFLRDVTGLFLTMLNTRASLANSFASKPFLYLTKREPLRVAQVSTQGTLKRTLKEEERWRREESTRGTWRELGIVLLCLIAFQMR